MSYVSKGGCSWANRCPCGLGILNGSLGLHGRRVYCVNNPVFMSADGTAPLLCTPNLASK